MDIETQEEVDTLFPNQGGTLSGILYSFNFIAVGYGLFYSSNAQFVYTQSGMLDDMTAGVYGSLYPGGNIIGILIIGPMLYRLFSLKMTIILSLLISMFGWFLHIFILMPVFNNSSSKTMAMLLCARILVSVGCGVSFIYTPICVTDHVPFKNRHVLGLLPSMALNFGMFMASLVGWLFIYLDYQNGLKHIEIHEKILKTKAANFNSLSWCPVFGMITCFISILCLIFTRETKKNQDLPHNGLTDNLSPIKRITIKDYFKLFKTKKIQRQFLVGFGVAFFQQMIGINAVLYNATSIFSKSFGTHYSNQSIGALAGLMMGGIILLSTVNTILFGRYLNRNTILYISSTILLFCNIVLGLYFYFDIRFPWLGSLLMIIYCFIFYSSWNPVPNSIISEIYSSNIRSFGCSFSTFIRALFGFIVAVSYAPLKGIIGIHGIFWNFALISLVSIGFVYFFVPETKSKTLEEIQELF